MLLYHYSKDRYNSLTTREFRGLKIDEEMLKRKREYVPGNYNQHISFFFDPIPFQILGKIYGEGHAAWYPGSELYQYIVDSRDIGKFAYHIVESPESVEMVLDDDVTIEQYHERFAVIAKEKLYIGYSNSELERATRQFTGKTRKYFEEAGKKPTFDTVRDKYAAFVPHVMLYPKGGVVEYIEVDKIRIR